MMAAYSYSEALQYSAMASSHNGVVLGKRLDVEKLRRMPKVPEIRDQCGVRPEPWQAAEYLTFLRFKGEQARDGKITLNHSKKECCSLLPQLSYKVSIMY